MAIDQVEDGSNADPEKKRTYPGSTLVENPNSCTDYSKYELCHLSKKSKVRQTFPVKLYAIISKVEYQHIISWMPRG